MKCAICKCNKETLYPVDYEAEHGSIHGTPVFVCASCYRKRELEQEKERAKLGRS